jgi:LDH2 family malate/lactate/ureidoglycolate dehydrogenase
MGDETLLPGEAEHLTRQRHRDEGVPVSAADAASLGDLAREAGLDEAAIPDPFR